MGQHCYRACQSENSSWSECRRAEGLRCRSGVPRESKMKTSRSNPCTGALAVFFLVTTATLAGGQETSEMRCRGGGFSIDTVGTRTYSTGETILTLALRFNYTAQWVSSVYISATHEIPAHWELGRSSCAWLGTSNGGPYESAKPAEIRFETPANAQLKQRLHGSEVDTSPTAAERYPDARTIPEYLRNSNHYWTFHISNLVCAPANCETPGSVVLHLFANAHGHYKKPVNLGNVPRPAEDFKAPRKSNRVIDASGLGTREAATDAGAGALETDDGTSTRAAAKTADGIPPESSFPPSPLTNVLGNATTAETLAGQVAKKTSQSGSTAVRPAARVRVPGGPTKSTLSICEAATQARARNSPAAPGLEKQCAAQRAIEATSVASSETPTASQSAQARKAELQAKVADDQQRLKEIAAESKQAQDRSAFSTFIDALFGSDGGRRTTGNGAAVEKQSAGGATRRTASAFELDNTITVQVGYRKDLGYKGHASAFGDVGPTSCNAFSVSAAVSDGSGRQQNPIPISSNGKMEAAGDYYVCRYIASEIPLDQAIAVSVAVFHPDLSATWQGGDAAQPPAGQQRTIVDPTRTATLTASRPRARLSYEMVYAPLPRTGDSR